MRHDDQISKIQEDYARLAECYDTRWQNFHDCAHSWITDRIKNIENVLDLGCGTGLLLKKIAQEFPHANLTGIDACPQMLEKARTRLPKATLIESDLTTHQIKGQFDIVLSVNVLHHLQDPQAHIGSLRQSCTENGTVFLCDFAINTLSLKLTELYWRTHHPAHHKAFSSQVLERTLKKTFEIKDSAILAPDRFWRLQIYQLSSKNR